MDAESPASVRVASGASCSLPGRSPFSSSSVTRHLLRGALGALLVALALGSFAAHPVLAVTAGLGAIVAWRGCPMCWTIGLFETVAGRLTNR